MKRIAILALLLSFSAAGKFSEEIVCGTYDGSEYPYKKMFKGSVETEITEADAEVRYFFDTLGETTLEQRQWLFELVDKETGKYKKSFPRRSPYTDNKVAIEHQTIQPHVVFKIGSNTVAGSNNGEFGGELVLIEENGTVSHIADMNVEDIYQMPFGVTVTSGLAHMGSNFGDVHIIQGEFKLEKFYGLVGAPRSSWLLSNGDLLINSHPTGSQVLTKAGYLKRVKCITNKSIQPTSG